MSCPFTGVLAIDGPSGTGKSTVARDVASALSARYLDSGAMYRAATLQLLRTPGGMDDIVGAAAAGFPIEVAIDPAHPSVRLGGKRVDTEIRASAVTAAVSAVSAVPQVRSVLVEQQRAIIARGGPIVVEGRDIGTVVAPDAAVKLYLTASPSARARRRAGQDGTDVATVAASIDRRDAADSGRAVSPLRPAPDAIEVDTTALSRAQVVERVLDLVAATAGSTR